MRLIQTIFILCLLCLQTTAQPQEIDQAMWHYDQFVLRGSYDSIANMFATNGSLEGQGQLPVTGREPIRKLLLSFKGASMIKYETVPKSTSFGADTAVQTGSYIQIVKIPSGDTLELGGQYNVTWLKANNNEWNIKRMYTHDYRNLKEERWANTLPDNSTAKKFMEALLKTGENNAEAALKKMIRDTTHYYLKETEFNRLGYHLMGMNKKKEAMIVFKTTTQLFPLSWNAYDSYAEALLQIGKREDAIRMYRKSIDLNSNNTNGKLVLEKLEKSK